ncbi:MAG: 2-hydroxyglutaryl-CoA dehydratase [Proteobacteria bacterium]|nr:2-hydroxyglutaryl-CoA dehydratase [Pseudomonadota bacterium]
MEQERTFRAGIDIGTESVNIVVMNDARIIYSQTLVTEQAGPVAVKALLDQAAAEMKWPSGFVPPLVSTGIGKKTIPLALKTSTDMVCHAEGARWHFPEARTVIDIGASGSRVLRLSAMGRVEKFAVNAKCASGTGIYLRNMTQILESSFEEMSALSEGVSESTEVSNYCAVFAESEVISMIHSGESKERLAAGVFDAVVDRLMEQINRVGLNAPLVMTGGVARNQGLVRSLERRVGLRAMIPPEPEIVGALGAALMAGKEIEAPAKRLEVGDH